MSRNVKAVVFKKKIKNQLKDIFWKLRKRDHLLKLILSNFIVPLNIWWEFNIEKNNFNIIMTSLTQTMENTTEVEYISIYDKPKRGRGRPTTCKLSDEEKAESHRN